MTALFDPARHEPLVPTAWDADIARAGVQRIADRALAEWDGDAGWPSHPQDDPASPDERFSPLYMGAGGVVWALRHLARQGAITPLAPGQFDDLVAALPARNHAALAGAPHGTASFLLGDTGLWLLQWQQRPDDALADAIFDAVQANIANPVNEALWGSPGTVLAAIHLAEATGQARWTALLQQAVHAQTASLHPDPDTGTPMWTQDLYGRQVRYLGAGHGFVGNAYPVLRGAALLPAELRQPVLDATLATLQALALRGGAAEGLVDGEGDGEAINWHPMSDAARVQGRLPLVQDCHGAPGMLVRLADAPRTAAWDALLQGAATLTWQAGPVAKGPSLCHGTAGNAMALLKQWQRSGDARWLARARLFALHALAQVEAGWAQHGRGRHSLWTGDLGVACCLWQCVQGSAQFPTLDVF